MTEEDAFRAARSLSQASGYAVASAVSIKTKQPDGLAGFQASAIAHMRSAADSFGLELVPKSEGE